MRLSENGAVSSVRLTPTSYAASLLDLATDGISTRCVPQNKRTASLPLARSRSGWRRIGYRGPEQAGQESSKEVLSKALKTVALRSACDHYRQAQELQCCETEVIPSVEHVQQKYQNNRAENSHQPNRLREKVMRGFKSSGHAQRFLSAFGVITSHFRVGRHLYGAHAYRAVMKLRLAVWEEAICTS
jgi:DDE domain